MVKKKIKNKDLKTIKKKIKSLKVALREHQIEKAEADYVLIEQLELWDQHLSPYEKAYRKAKKRVKKSKRTIAALNSLLKKSTKKRKSGRLSTDYSCADNIESIPSSAKIVPTEPIGSDLKKIEGIGPKIEAILKSNGIQTYTDLAEASVLALREMLLCAGNRFKKYQPNTWPEQAALAARSDWNALKELQHNLHGGKKN